MSEETTATEKPAIKEATVTTNSSGAVLSLSPRAAYALYSTLGTVPRSEYNDELIVAIHGELMDQLGMRDHVEAARARSAAEKAEREKRPWALSKQSKPARENAGVVERVAKRVKGTAKTPKPRAAERVEESEDEMILGDNSAQLRALAEKEKDVQ